jgi:deferrochelatase/peroxidase EfeB
MNPTTPGLDDVQGNILKGHGRKYSALLLFRFARRSEFAAENRRLLRDAATGVHEDLAITSAARQQLHSDAHRLNLAAEEAFRSLGLSTHGLAACGYTAKNLGITGQLDSDQFWQGASQELLGDPKPWEEAFAMEPDGVFMLAHAKKDGCTAMVTAVTALLQNEYGVGTVKVERGFRWTPLKDQGDDATYEHFGFADGFARTMMVAASASPLKQLVDPSMGFVKNNVPPFEIPLGQVMIEDEGPFRGGSFLVVNKLEQNVRAFLEAETYLEEHQPQPPATRLFRRAAALFIGRERDGTPLVRGKKRRTDIFHFGGDPGATRCPFSAHIRKMNPRQNKFKDHPHEQAERTIQKSAQFVRRGVLYGDEQQVRLDWPSPAEAPQEKVGLLFMGYMARTGAQFLKMYFNWGPESQFPQRDSGPDALLGGGGKLWAWPQHKELTDPANPLTLGQFITSKGAGFFIVPPLKWLRNPPSP